MSTPATDNGHSSPYQFHGVDDYSFTPPISEDDVYSSTPAFRPRYSVEESSDAAYEKDQKHRRCMGRKRRAVRILFMAIFILVAGVFTRIYMFFGSFGAGKRRGVGKLSFKQASNETSSYDRAMEDSYGFFDNTNNEEWIQLKSDTMRIIDIQDGVKDRTAYLLSESGANIDSNQWWKNNWRINFTCKNKVRIGTKYICDPTRMASMANESPNENNKHWGIGQKRKSSNEPSECIVYISGGNAIEFAHQFLDYSIARMVELGLVEMKLCEMHIFLPDQGLQAQEQRDNIIIHNWGFRPSNKESMGLASGAGTTSITFRTIPETITELDHSGKVSLLVLDCESCEWDIYPDLLLLDEPIQQVILQMHGTPYMANELFSHMQEEGYVIFHRERAISDDEVYDYSWLKLAPSFFNWEA